MPEVTSYTPGAFCWVELTTTDTDAALAFYQGLFGWTRKDIPMGDYGVYIMLQKNGKDAGAMYKGDQPGVPPNWASYIATPDVDATAEKAKSLGANILAGPFDVFDSGRMAMIADPQGAVFGAWQAKNHIGATIRDEANTLCWNELYTPDAGASRSFYTQLFEWNVKISSGDQPYTEVTPADTQQPTGGIFEMKGEHFEGVPPHWMPYFMVDDCDATVEKAKSLGGNITMPPMDVPKVGRFAMIQDPQGARFCVIKLSF